MSGWGYNRNFRTFSTGSANVLPMTDKEKKEIEKKSVKISFGFSLDRVKNDNQDLTNEDDNDRMQT